MYNCIGVKHRTARLQTDDNRSGIVQSYPRAMFRRKERNGDITGETKEISDADGCLAHVHHVIGVDVVLILGGVGSKNLVAWPEVTLVDGGARASP